MNSLFTRFSTRQLVTYGLIISVVFIAVVGWLEWETVSDLHHTRDLVRHSRSVQFALKDFGYSVSAAESGQLEYLLTQNAVYLEPYNTSVKSAKDGLDSLRTLVSDNPEQTKNLDAAESWYNQKLDFMNQTIALEQAGNHAGALQLMNQDTGKKTMDGFLAAIQTMQDTELKLVWARQQIYQANFKFTTELSVALLILCFVFIVAILLLAQRLQQVQSVVTLKALTELIEYEGGMITIDEYLRRRKVALLTHGPAQVEAERMLGLLEKRKLKTASQRL